MSMPLRLLPLSFALLAAVTQAHADPVTLRFGEIPSSAHGMTSLAIFIAERKGFFARENIVLDPQRANARLDELVGAYGDAEGLKRAYQQNTDAMRQVESLALEDQVVDWILDHAKVHAKVSTFKELMNFEG